MKPMQHSLPSLSILMEVGSCQADAMVGIQETYCQGLFDCREKQFRLLMTPLYSTLTVIWKGKRFVIAVSTFYSISVRSDGINF